MPVQEYDNKSSQLNKVFFFFTVSVVIKLLAQLQLGYSNHEHLIILYSFYDYPMSVTHINNKN